MLFSQITFLRLAPNLILLLNPNILHQPLIVHPTDILNHQLFALLSFSLFINIQIKRPIVANADLCALVLWFSYFL